MEYEILQAHLLPAHAYLLVSIPLKYSASQIDEFIKNE